MQRPFAQVDVFGSRAYMGNPLAVVLDGTGLSAGQMQEVASWATVAETTFVLPPTQPGASYRARIFTPSTELPFAGHPTLGTAHAWLGHQGRSAASLVQECAAGLVPVEERGYGLAFAGPPLVRTGPVSPTDLGHFCRALKLPAGEVADAQWVDNGPGWVALLLSGGAPAVLAVQPGPLDCFVGLVGMYPEGHEAAYEVRAFSPGPGGMAVEDPVTGSLNASVAAWMISSGRAWPPYMVTQGTALSRQGNVYIDQGAEGNVWVGGRTVTCMSGIIDI